MESVLGKRKGKSWAELHEDGSVVACDTVSLSCFIISLLSVSGGRRKMMEEVIQKCCYVTNCALTPKSIFFSALHSIVCQWRIHCFQDQM